MPTQNDNRADDSDRSAAEKIEMLRHLAAEGFRSIDHGNGLTIRSETALRNVIAEIAQRAIKKLKADRAEQHSP